MFRIIRKVRNSFSHPEYPVYPCLDLFSSSANDESQVPSGTRGNLDVLVGGLSMSSYAYCFGHCGQPVIPSPERQIAQKR